MGYIIDFKIYKNKKNKKSLCVKYPCDRIFPLIDTLGLILWARRPLLLQKLHSVPLVIQLCLVTLPELQEQSYYSQDINRKQEAGKNKQGNNKTELNKTIITVLYI